MSERFRSALLIGPPGAGKGTQGKLLGEQDAFFHSSSGDVFRSMPDEAPLTKEVRAIMSTGELVPDDLTIRLWRSDVDRRCTQGEYRPDTQLLLLDGIPRNTNQAQLMDEHVDVVCIVQLVCSDEDAFVQRIRKRAEELGRVDDTDESVIRNRFEVYKQETRHVLDHYRPGLIAQVDAMGTIEEVQRGCLDVLAPLTTGN